MNRLKILKIKILVLVFCLSPACFGNDKNSSYENLLALVKEANFVKFKELYSQSTISDQQKKELLSVANNTIETERKYWRSNRPFGPESSIGKEVKSGINAGYILAGIFGMIAPTSLGLILRKYFNEKDKFLTNYQNLWNRATPIPSYSNAALEAKTIDLRKSFWFSDLVGLSIMSGFTLAFSIAILVLVKLNQKILRSYKRWKKACKIKKLIDPNAPVLQWVKITK